MRAHRAPIKVEQSSAAKVVNIIEELYARAIRFVEVIDAAVFGTIARQRRLPPEELSHSRHAQEYPELHVAGFICQTLRASRPTCASSDIQLCGPRYDDIKLDTIVFRYSKSRGQAPLLDETVTQRASGTLCVSSSRLFPVTMTCNVSVTSW